ncbi:MAG: formate dehydrogenase [Lentisphaerae bacterium]|nr:formate dehydrogenase [Lentisphaerota bacterium]
MSRNVSMLSGRKGLRDNLFERVVEAGAESADAHRALAQEFLVGEAVTLGAASFYDLLSGPNAGKKALVCNGSACLCAGTQPRVAEALGRAFKPEDVGVITCLGRCHENAAFHIAGRNFSGRDVDNLAAILATPEVPRRDTYAVAAHGTPAVLTAAFPGVAAYYEPLREILQRPPEAALDEVTRARLRGRGGAGFPTGAKWAAAKAAPGARKYIVCNGDEGDPGAYIDRYLLEQQPHRVLFGMLVAGWVVGASEGVVYIRAEYPEAVEATRAAVREAEAAGAAGARVFGTDFSFTFKVIAGAGAYICGEETALIASIEGRRPEVSARPPYPTTQGLYGQPTVVNNVETFAHVHQILIAGGEAFARIGTPQSTGAKLVCLNGVFNRPGLYEVPMGTPLTTVIDTLGGGFRVPVKALHIGGPLGGLVPKSMFGSLTIDFESFREAGFLLGHGSILGIPESFPMIQYLEHLMEFCAAESCGKCFPCRLGSTRGQEMLAAAAHGRAKLNRELLNDLLDTMALTSLCAHGSGVPLPIQNALKHFEGELREYFE